MGEPRQNYFLQRLGYIFLLRLTANRMVNIASMARTVEIVNSGVIGGVAEGSFDGGMLRVAEGEVEEVEVAEEFGLGVGLGVGVEFVVGVGFGVSVGFGVGVGD